MIYVIEVAGSAFGAGGFGSVAITDQHNSPSKSDSFEPTVCTGCVTNIATAVAVAGGQALDPQTAQEIVCSGTPIPPTGECPKKDKDWKKNTNVWPAGYSPNEPVTDLFVAASGYPKVASKTLLQALDGKAGDKEVKDVLKQGVAAVLNAATPSIQYPFTVDEVIMAVNMALDDGRKDTLKSLKELLQDANDNKDCKEPSKDADCTTDGRPNVLTLTYTGASCAQSSNSQQEGKTSCMEMSGGPNGASTVRIVASDSSDPGSDQVYFDQTVSLNETFDVPAAGANEDKFESNTYFHVYVGGTLVQTIQIHTSCSAPLIRGETFGSLLLEDYRIELQP